MLIRELESAECLGDRGFLSAFGVSYIRELLTYPGISSHAVMAAPLLRVDSRRFPGVDCALWCP